MNFADLEIEEKLSRNATFASKVRAKKKCMIDEAISWKGSANREDLIYHDLWASKDGKYNVKLGKFGKEYHLTTIKHKDGTVGNNPNDMHPTVYVDGVIRDFDGSFDHVFNFFQEVSEKSKDALRILGCLVFRNSLLLDHKLVNDENGISSYRYQPSEDAISFISERFPLYDGIPIEAYLHYMEAIAWNEDVKYYTLGYDVFKQGTGRTNNMKTYANLIAVLLGKASFVKLCSSFSRPPVGVSPITNNAALEAFPELKIKI